MLMPLYNWTSTCSSCTTVSMIVVGKGYEIGKTLSLAVLCASVEADNVIRMPLLVFHPPKSRSSRNGNLRTVPFVNCLVHRRNPAILPRTMFAIVDIAGFQETVRAGDTLDVPLLEGAPGEKVAFDKVYLIVDDAGQIRLGEPVVAGVSVQAKILEHGKGDKIRIAKFRRRKRYLKFRGHRQNYTTIEVTGITG